MENFLQKNWFKLIVVVLLLTITVAVVYYVIAKTASDTVVPISTVPAQSTAFDSYINTVNTNPSPTIPTVVPVANTTKPAVISQPSWHTAFTYSGESSTGSAPFEMRGSHWRATLSCQASAEFGGVNVILIGGPNIETEQFGGVTDCPSNKVYDFYNHTPGSYTLTTNANNVNYSVKIEDYY
jgi:hypothetical protein